MGWGQITKQLTEAKERQEAFQRGDFKPMIFPLMIKAGQEPAIVSFVGNTSEDGTEPWASKVHTLPPPPGKKMLVTRACLGNNCPYCEQENKPKFRAFFSVIDHRKRTFTKRDGEEGSVENSLAYYECSAANADMLFQKLNKAIRKNGGSLEDYVVEISKFGSGTSTTTSYDFDLRKSTNYVLPEEVEAINFAELFVAASPSVLYD
ncbi:MAG: hypothetical protein AABY07_00965 [Nanoarchaeota archaeon]